MGAASKGWALPAGMHTSFQWKLYKVLHGRLRRASGSTWKHNISHEKWQHSWQRQYFQGCIYCQMFWLVRPKGCLPLWKAAEEQRGWPALHSLLIPLRPGGQVVHPTDFSALRVIGSTSGNPTSGALLNHDTGVLWRVRFLRRPAEVGKQDGFAHPALDENWASWREKKMQSSMAFWVYLIILSGSQQDQPWYHCTGHFACG